MMMIIDINMVQKINGWRTNFDVNWHVCYYQNWFIAYIFILLVRRTEQSYLVIYMPLKYLVMKRFDINQI